MAAASGVRIITCSFTELPNAMVNMINILIIIIIYTSIYKKNYPLLFLISNVH